MGSTFGNINILKLDNENFLETVERAIMETMEKKGYVKVKDQTIAETTISIMNRKESKWITIYGDEFDDEYPKQLLKYAKAMSNKIKSYLLVCNSYDSDYVLLNLLHKDKKINDMVVIGHMPSEVMMKPVLPHNAEQWKPLAEVLKTGDKLENILENNYELPEDILPPLGDEIQARSEDLNARYDDFEPESTHNIYFSSNSDLEEDKPFIREGKPEIRSHYGTFDPMFMDESYFHEYQNYGGMSKGVGVYIFGPFVKDEEVTFDPIELYCFDYKHKKDEQKIVFQTISKKMQFNDGRWAYEALFPDFEIPEGINENSKKQHGKKIWEADQLRRFGLQFTPHGNKKYELDIEFVVLPLVDYSNQVYFRCWINKKTKKEYVDDWNKRVKKFQENNDSSDPTGIILSQMRYNNYLDEKLYLYDEK